MSNVTPLRPKKAKTARRRPRAGLIVGIVAACLAVALVLAVVLSNFYVLWLWFGEVHLRQVFWTQIWWRLLTGLLFGAIFFVIFYASIEAARRLSPKHRLVEGVDVVEYVNERAARAVRLAGLIVALVLALGVAVGASTDWLVVQRALHGVSFGQSDPLFHHDYGFYIFTLPFWRALYATVAGALVAALVGAAVVHLILGGLVVEQKPGPAPHEPANAPSDDPFARLRRRPNAPLPTISVHPSGKAIAQLSAILAAIFVLTGIGSLMRAWELVYSTAGVVAGAGYTDVHVVLPGTRVTMVAAFVIAAVLIVNVWRRRWRWPLYVVGAWIVLLILVRVAAPALVQALVVNPNQQTKERQYIGYNLAATRSAFKLDAFSEQQFPLQGDLTPAKLKVNDATIRNIRLWDPGTLLTSYRQLQELRKFYNFNDVDVDRYSVNGVYRETMLSAREMNLSGLNASAQTWVNEHLVYTHGFGACVSAVNQVTPDGSPDFLVQDVPPVSTAPDLSITQPRIYFGESGTDYTLVKTKVREYDYPGGTGNEVYTHYSGNGGVPIGSLINRLAFCVRFGTLQFLTTNALDSQSRAIIRSTIMDRVKGAAPFLGFDHDPYMVIADGRLVWMVDAYTTTDRYPYSQPQDGTNYMRNSVKVTIDAYDGTMTFYAFDPADPILRTYEGIFPGMFKPMTEMPQTLLAHVRYPEDYFNVQAQVFTTYHVTEPDVLYNKGDQWQIPQNVSLSGQGSMSPYYVIMRLPAEAKEEFLLMLPFVPNERQNMIAWLGARCDVPHYGKAVSFEFPKSLTVYGPTQVESAVNIDPEISAQVTLWSQQGSSVIHGNLLVMPIEDSLLYVQPLYLQSTGTGNLLPQFKRVIVFYRATTPAGVSELGGQDQVVVMRPTLGEALTAVFSGAPPPGSGNTAAGTQTGGGASSGGASATVKALIAQANRQYDAAQTALKAGDWAEYGRQITALKQTLSRLSATQP